MRRILTSVFVIALVALAAFGATRAFFSDTETSTGNTFAAGSLDLKVDNECHYYNFVGVESGVEGVITEGELAGYVDVGCPWDGVNGMLANWEQTDLVDGVHKFFFFEDIKPGDRGEDTISLHVVDNDAWGRFIISPLEQIPGLDGENDLREALLFSAWLDQGEIPGFQCGQEGDIVNGACVEDPEEGDNIRQSELEPVVITEGTVDEGGETHNIWEALAAVRAGTPACAAADPSGDTAYGPCHGLAVDGRMVGSATYYFGLAWILPDTVGDEVQGDSLSADLSFEVEQHRNNPTPFED